MVILTARDFGFMHRLQNVTPVRCDSTIRSFLMISSSLISARQLLIILITLGEAPHYVIISVMLSLSLLCSSIRRDKYP
jgi:hypothetical protein